MVELNILCKKLKNLLTQKRKIGALNTIFHSTS
nr:MAG TPA: hypothetical protein [Caudoviricetes sp.]